VHLGRERRVFEHVRESFNEVWVLLEVLSEFGVSEGKSVVY